jgi:tRNA(adenine34) deaminase
MNQGEKPMTDDYDGGVMRQVIVASEDSFSSDGTPDPFAAIMVHDGDIIGAASGGKEHPGGHPEVELIRRAVDDLGLDLGECTLYTNAEPCAACAAVARDYNVGRIVWGVSSPVWGGESRWGILSAEIEPEFTAAKVAQSPVIRAGVLEGEARRVFDRLGWRMFDPTTKEEAKE